MGLSGAENTATNTLLLEYLRSQHGDLAEALFLTSDAVAAVATCFEKSLKFKFFGFNLKNYFRRYCSNCGYWFYLSSFEGKKYFLK